MSAKDKNLQNLAVNTIRLLSADAVQKANSGHPGMPMGCAPIAHLLYSKILKHNPANSGWLNRDRFILSAGHGSMLLYSVLHLSGYKLSLDDLKNFRQWGSLTPGHPEVDHTDGVETTTGPLGQGFANAIGMAVAYEFLANKFKKDNFKVLDHNIYALVSDGEMMEGISHEAASFAGHNKLGNLVVLYDDNNISIDGEISLAMSDDTQRRFEAYGWHVQKVEDVNNLDDLEAKILIAKAHKTQPSLIIAKTNIGFGSPNKQGKESSHGAPLGKEELILTKRNLGFPEDKSFYIPEEVVELYSLAKKAGIEKEAEWNILFENYKTAYPADAQLFTNIFNGEFGNEWEENLPIFKPEDGAMASRSVSGKLINILADYLPTFIGGSADLAPSNNTNIKKETDFSATNYGGRNFHFGVREHGMGSIINGMSLYGGLIPFGATFLVFADYMRPPIRMAALMKKQCIYVFTHDSIGVGEDGPTHQPIEHLTSLRCIPNIIVLRPCDANETVKAWQYAIKRKDGPVCLILTRQNLETLDRQKYASADGVFKGAYVLKDSEGTPDAILIATGSEVGVTLQAAEELEKQGKKIRVVSFPSWNLFEAQSDEYKNSVLLPEVKNRVIIEAGASYGWYKYIGLNGKCVTRNSFGASAPGELLFEKFGFTVENIVKTVNEF